VEAYQHAVKFVWSAIVRGGSPRGHRPKRDDQDDVEKARPRLARPLLSVANNHSRDVEALKTCALEAMALAYPTARDNRGKAWMFPGRRKAMLSD